MGVSGSRRHRQLGLLLHSHKPCLALLLSILLRPARLMCILILKNGSPSQPINVVNGHVARTDKRLSWMKDEDLRLISAWLNNSNDPIESNFKKNDKYWGDVAAAYNSTTPKNRARLVKQVKDRFGKIRKKVGNFCCSWKEVNSLYASGESNEDLMNKAQKIYENDFKDGPFLFMHCWNELKKQPKWHAYLEQLDKSNKRKADYNDVIPLDDEEDIPRPIGAKASKAQRSCKEKSKVQVCTTELEDDIRKFMDAHAATKEGQNEVLETQIRVSIDNHAAKKLSRQTAMIETYRDLMNKDTRKMPDDMRSELVHMLKCMREEIFNKNQ
ncbi:glutathione S-transferase T3 isoform X2 [Oryza sativa Japonica Group]|uniref:glutathione S-transferase T3 isoform X2 n=1 Tax=Oryza sativa subsp. japonica TaxID=39947 RepID=UPI00077551E3